MRTAKASLEDLQEILALQREAFDTEARLVSNYYFHSMQETYEELVEDFHQGVFLKTVNESNQIIASVRGIPTDDGSVYISKLVVKPEYHSKGIGGNLLSKIEAEFPGKSYDLISTTTFEKNVNFYKSRGYQEQKREIDPDNIEIIYFHKPASSN